MEDRRFVSTNASSFSHADINAIYNVTRIHAKSLINLALAERCATRKGRIAIIFVLNFAILVSSANPSPAKLKF